MITLPELPSGLDRIITSHIPFEGEEDVRRKVQAYARQAIREYISSQEVVAWASTDEEGSPAMLFPDRDEAASYCGEDGPLPLIVKQELKDADE